MVPGFFLLTGYFLPLSDFPYYNIYCVI